MNGIEVLARTFLDEGLEELYYYYTHCGTVPSILHTSREARTVGLQYYQLEFGTETKEMFSRPSRGSLSFSTPPRIFVNWECDIIYPITDSQSDLEDPEISLALASMYPQIRRFAIPAGDIRGKPQFGASLHQDLRPLIALLSKPEGSPSMPLHEVILYCYRSSDTPEICEFDHVSLQFASICGIDDQNTVPIPLWGTVQLQHMREARDNVMRVIEVVSGRSKQKNKKFVPPVISFAFLDVSWRSRSNARKRSILGNRKLLMRESFHLEFLFEVRLVTCGIFFILKLDYG